MFTDADGAPVYAAFCAISERLLRPALARPGALLTIGSRLRRLTATRLISLHDLAIDGHAFAEIILVTAFVRHGAAGGNAHIIRVQPCGRLDLPPLEAGADRGFVAEAGLLYHDLPASSAAVALSTDVTPCPTTDFNAAGLLYCANYPGLADRAEWALYPDLARSPLTSRKIVYLGNVDPGDPVTATLYRARQPDRGHCLILASGPRIIARIVTEKRD
ncbi:hypothetical protein FALB51S_02093 [Frigidibacter albus]